MQKWLYESVGSIGIMQLAVQFCGGCTIYRSLLVIVLVFIDNSRIHCW